MSHLDVTSSGEHLNLIPQSTGLRAGRDDRVGLAVFSATRQSMQSHLSVQPLEASSIAATEYHNTGPCHLCLLEFIYLTSARGFKILEFLCRETGSPVLDIRKEARVWIHDYPIASGLRAKPVAIQAHSLKPQRREAMA